MNEWLDKYLKIMNECVVMFFFSLTSILFCLMRNNGDSGKKTNKPANINITATTNFGIAKKPK